MCSPDLPNAAIRLLWGYVKSLSKEWVSRLGEFSIRKVGVRMVDEREKTWVCVKKSGLMRCDFLSYTCKAGIPSVLKTMQSNRYLAFQFPPNTSISLSSRLSTP